MIRILIADDHAIVRKGFAQIIAESSGMKVADEAGNGREALEKALKKDYDVVVLDISMPGRGGLEVLKELKKSKPGLPVLILSIHPEEQYAVRALKAGAAGYLTKESAPDELIRAIRKVTRGGKYVSASLAEKLAVDLDAWSKRPRHETLSDREFQVMCLLGSGKPVKEIAGQLALSVKTISTYRGRILQKLGLDNNAQLTHYVLENKLSI
ncbi:MAG: response regulator transcription factor [Pseudomonadota bacterium]